MTRNGFQCALVRQSHPGHRRVVLWPWPMLVDLITLSWCQRFAKGHTFVQILHNVSKHWLLVSNINCLVNTPHQHGSLHFFPTADIKKQTAMLVAYDAPAPVINLQFMNAAHYNDGSNWSLLTLIYASSQYPSQVWVSMCYQLENLQNHLLNCLKN